MWLFSSEVFFTWFGFWQFIGVMYVLSFCFLLLALIVKRKAEEKHTTRVRDINNQLRNSAYEYLT